MEPVLKIERERALCPKGSCDAYLAGGLSLALELGQHPVHDGGVKVLTTQVRVTSGGQHLEQTSLELQQGHVERATTQIEHQDGL